jgi:hypothetical protein
MAVAKSFITRFPKAGCSIIDGSNFGNEEDYEDFPGR